MEVTTISRYPLFFFLSVLFAACSVYDASIIDNRSNNSDSSLPISQDAAFPDSGDAKSGDVFAPDSAIKADTSVLDEDSGTDDADTSATSDSGADTSSKDADAIDGEGGIGQGDASCSEDRTEVCNGLDDDCDGETDEEPASSACQLDHARAICDEQRCVVEQCETGWLDCDFQDANGCEHDESEGPCPVLRVLYRPGQGDTKWVRPQLVIQNPTADDVTLSDLAIRYYYTIDSTSSTQFSECWHPGDSADCASGFCCDKHIIIRIDTTSGTDADHYIEVSFTGTTIIAPGSETDHISVGVHVDTWEDFNYANDYSYEPFTEYTVTDRITLYREGELIWGIEP